MKKQESIEKALKQYFGYDSFQTGQEEIITDVLKKEDVLGVLPTGSGKSICYQLPALIQQGITIVITPLISLMIDQVRELKAKGIRNVIALNSFMSWKERRKAFKSLHKYKIIYISPELIQQKSLLRILQSLDVSLFVIDEAHCISQWGHEFRTDYLRLTKIVDMLSRPPILALTATATKEVQEDILNILNRPMAKKHIYSIDRPNIAFLIEKVQGKKEKLEEITNLLTKFHVPTLIYFSSRLETEIVSEDLRKQLPHLEIAFYHGGMDPIDRLTIQQQFMKGQIDVICCTSAFGMGINKQNLRLVIHYHFPLDLESYIQEVGRAGRDGKLSLGIVLYSSEDIHIQNHIIEHRFPKREVLIKIHQLIINNQGRTFVELIDEIVDILKKDEVHFNFLQYQLEKHGIIKHNHISQNRHKINQAFNNIYNHIQQRYDLKRVKLIDMMKWLQSTTCLRSSIYKYFHSDFQKVENCCSNCGFTIDDWQPKQISRRVIQKNFNWREKLSKLLLNEDAYEVEGCIKKH